MAVSFKTLRDQARARADMTDSGFVTEDELKLYVNSSMKELYDILVTQYQDQYIKKVAITLAPGQEQISLPADFYKLRGIDYQVTSDYAIDLRQFNFKDRNKQNALRFYNGFIVPDIQYKVLGSNVQFISGANYTGGGWSGALWYVPLAADLQLDTDTFDAINGYEEYIILDVAIKMLQKEESDVTTLVVLKQAMLKRIEGAAANRDAAEPQKIADVMSRWQKY